MAETDELLRRWREAGLIDGVLAERIAAFEREQTVAAPGRSRAAADERPGIIEVLLYLGFTVAGVGVFFFVALQWDEIESWARVALVAVPALLCLAAGAAMNPSNEPGIRRAGHLAWLLAVGLVAGALLVILNEYGPEDDGGQGGSSLFVLVGLVALATALVLWAFSPSNPQVLAVGVSCVLFGEALGAWPGEYNTRIAGVTILMAGAIMVALVETGRFHPRLTAAPIGAALLGGGAYHAGLDSPVAWELLAFVAGAGLIALGVWRGAFTYVTIGALTLVVALITFMFVHFNNEISAPLALMLSGGLIVAAVLVLMQVRNIVRARRAPA